MMSAGNDPPQALPRGTAGVSGTGGVDTAV